jgi:hypothetical protein
MVMMINQKTFVAITVMAILSFSMVALALSQDVEAGSRKNGISGSGSGSNGNVGSSGTNGANGGNGNNGGSGISGGGCSGCG